MAMTPHPNQEDSWLEYRRLVLAEIERLDRRADRITEQLRTHETSNSDKFSAMRTDLELLKARFVGFTKEVETLVKEELRKAATAPPPTPKETSEYIRGMWEFRVAVATGIVSVLIAIIALLN